MAYVLDVRRLRVLLAVSEHGRVAAAARALAFTPPAVSQQIAALERQVGLALVDRTGRTMRLTPAGQRLAGHARRVLADLEAAEADLAAFDGTVRGTLRVGAISTLGRGLLPATLAHLARSAPGLDLRVEQLEPEDSLPALTRGDLDVALAGEYAMTPRRPDAQVERVDLFTEPVLVAVPRDHPVTGTAVRLADLRDERFIAPAAGSACAVLLERSCALAGYEPHVVARCADFAVALALAAAGLGVALVPRIASGPDADLPVRLLTASDPPISRTLYAAVRPGAVGHPSIACLLEALTTAAGPLQRGR